MKLDDYAVILATDKIAFINHKKPISFLFSRIEMYIYLSCMHSLDPYVDPSSHTNHGQRDPLGQGQYSCFFN